MQKKCGQFPKVGDCSVLRRKVQGYIWNGLCVRCKTSVRV